MKIISIDLDKLEKYDLGAAYHQAWHEGESKDIYKGTIPEDVFRFIYACQKWVKEDIIEECKI